MSLRRAALVYNPTKVDDVDDLVGVVTRRAEADGWKEPLLLPTTADDPGRGVAEQAVAEGVDVILAAGGDGTVRGAVTAVVGTRTALALVPAGTGNLLARNLQLVHDFDEAIDVAFSGDDRVLDAGWVGDEAFAVMAGIGFDADMMVDAPEGLKKRIGWSAYLVSGARHLTDRGFTVELRIDDEEPVRRRARSVLIANVGKLQGGLEIFPDAVPDDGLLDVAIVGPRGLRDWAGIATRVVRRTQQPDDQRLETFRGTRVRVRTGAPQRRQLDGDPVEDADVLEATLRPRSLTVKVPRGTAAGDAP